MGRFPCCVDTSVLKKGPWTPEEDEKLTSYIQKHGHGSWQTLPKIAGLQRCGKSCRLRWTNYLRPDIKRGRFTQEEEDLIINLHSVLGNKWSRIATHLPGRTDNEIKNYWNTHIRKKLLNMGIDPITHKPRTDLNLLANLSHLFSTPPNQLASLMNPWDVNNILGSQPNLAELAKLQVLQNIVQILSTTNNYSLPTIDQMMPSNLGSLIPNLNGLVGNYNINPSLCTTSQGTNRSCHVPNYMDGVSTSNDNKSNLSNSCILNMNSTLDENRLPSLVISPSPEASTINQSDDQSNTNSTNGSSSLMAPVDDLFEGLEKLLDDGDSFSFWKQFLS